MSSERLERLFSTHKPIFQLPERHPLVESYHRSSALRKFLRPVVGRFGSWLEAVTDVLSCRAEPGARLLRCLRLLVEEIEGPVPRESGPLRESVTTLEALSRHGKPFLPEIVGITYAHGRLWRKEELVALCEPLLARFPRERIGRGIAFWLQAHDRWLELWRSGPRAEDPLEALRKKARYGIGHHRHVSLQDRPLDEWLKDFLRGRHEEAFLEALRRDFGRLKKSCAFGGPMFGVFSEEELAALDEALARRSNPAGREVGDVLNFSAGPATLPEGAQVLPQGVPSLSPRELFHRLLKASDDPTTLAAAARYVERLCRKARGEPPFGDSPETFRKWLDRRYFEALSPPPTTAPRLPKEVYLFLLEQFAPFVLLDGCWLLSSARIARRFPEVGKRLFRIYFDELGSGRPSWHHGNLYRKLLAGVGIELPPVESEAFLRHRAFLSRAFDLPALLLAIGCLADRFLPELLGLNLAVELSGLGAFYRDLARDLDHWGIDATVVRLHQSIDNPASGHTALAQEAILLFLTEAPDSPTRQFLWRRIWTGYRLLAITLRPFLFQLVLAVLWRYGVTIFRWRWRLRGRPSRAKA